MGIKIYGLYRGKTIAGDWVYGFYVKTQGKAYIHSKSGKIYSVLAKSVGQMSCLCDIEFHHAFDGDIVELFFGTCGNSQFPYRREIRILKFNILQGGFHLPEWDNIYNVSILGNVIDNPEMAIKYKKPISTYE